MYLVSRHCNRQKPRSKPINRANEGLRTMLHRCIETTTFTRTYDVSSLGWAAVGIEALGEFDTEGRAVLRDCVLRIFGTAGERILLVEQVVDARGSIRVFAERVTDQRGVQHGESSQSISGRRRYRPGVLSVQ